MRATFASLALGTALALPAASAANLNFYAWADYLAPDTVPAFQRSSGIHLRYDSFDSNEMLQSKLLTGRSGYDLVVPSNTFLARQIPAGVYQPLDKQRLPHWSGLDPAILQLMQSADPGNRYAVPLFWGINTLGINEARVARALGGPLPPRQWALLFQPDIVAKLKSCGVSLLDSPNEVFAAALHYLGKSPASQQAADYQAAAALLQRIRPYITRFSSSGYMDEMARGELCLALGYGGDLNIARRRAEAAGNGVRLRALVPAEGVGVWVDSFAVPRDAANVDAAYRFIDYNLQPRVAAANGDFVTYAPAVLAARPLMAVQHRNNPSIFPSAAELKNSYVLTPLAPALQRLVTRLWQDFKTRNY